MADNKQSREQLEKRRDEINAQLNRVNRDLQNELDRDPEEQAIEVEQEDVPITMEDNLRAELEQIEEKLQRMGEND
jgi:RNA polymerase-binding transcription factor DksA